MAIDEICDWIENLPVSVAVREYGWLFPIIETIHVLALITVVGSIGRVDLRLLGLWSSHRRISKLTAEILPWTIGAFGVAAISGGLLFCSHATKYYHDTPFRLKMLALLLAGINLLVFHRITARTLPEWDATKPPLAAKMAGGISLALWITILTLGRTVGFTL